MPRPSTNDAIVQRHAQLRKELIEKHAKVVAEKILKVKKLTVEQLVALIAEEFKSSQI